MKLPIPITPARINHADRDLIPLRPHHVLLVVTLVPLVAAVAFVIARLVFSIPS